MSIEIKKMELTNCEELGLIHTQSWQKAYRGIIPDNILDNMSAKRSEEKFRNSYNQGQGSDFIITQDSIAVGFICLGACRDKDLDEYSGEIWGIYLLPDYWGRGIGTEAITWGIAYLRNCGFKKITLWVFEENTRARRFYEKFGFIHDGTVKEVNIGKPLNEYRYSKLSCN